MQCGSKTLLVRNGTYKTAESRPEKLAEGGSEEKPREEGDEKMVR